MEIREYKVYKSEEILPLYESVGWTAYTAEPEALRLGFESSLLSLAAYDGEKLVGLIRTVGDGHTVVLVQDILIYPEYQRQGIGSSLLGEILSRFHHVRQIQLVTDNTEKTVAFYKSMGFSPLEELGGRGFMA